MPCANPGPGEMESAGYLLDSQLEALLCGIFRSKSLSILDDIDWKETGLEKEWAEAWWKRHCEKDELRREAEERTTYERLKAKYE